MNKRLAIFISGRGSTLQALLEVPHLPTALVVSNRKKAQGVLKATRNGVPTVYFGKDGIWSELSHELKQRRITHIFLCGFMKMIPADFIAEWEGRVINIHPSLLPLFPGAHGVADSLQAQGPFGVSLHEVTSAMDAGPIIVQRRIDRELGGHDLPELQMRVAQAEQGILRSWAYRYFWQSPSSYTRTWTSPFTTTTRGDLQ